jgi:hypothetical protein
MMPVLDALTEIDGGGGGGGDGGPQVKPALQCSLALAGRQRTARRCLCTSVCRVGWGRQQRGVGRRRVAPLLELSRSIALGPSDRADVSLLRLPGAQVAPAAESPITPGRAVLTDAAQLEARLSRVVNRAGQLEEVKRQLALERERNEKLRTALGVFEQLTAQELARQAARKKVAARSLAAARRWLASLVRHSPARIPKEQPRVLPICATDRALTALLLPRPPAAARRQLAGGAR